MKRLYGFIAALVIFLGVAFFMTQNNSSNTTTAKKKIPTVGILQLMSHPALDQIHKGFVAGLKEYGYTPGKNIKIDFQNAQGDQSNLKTMSTKFSNEKVSLMAGIATPAAQALANVAGKKTPVILAGITNPSGSGLVKTDKHPGANITGTSGESPLEKQLALIKTVMPNAKTIGIIYTSSDHGGTYNAKKFAALCKKEGINYKLYTISGTNDMQQVAEQMVSQVDTVYAPQDNEVAAAMKTLVEVANKSKIPVFAAADTMVKDGGLASYAISQYKLGKVAGEMAAQVLRGRKTTDFPVKYITKGEYVINTKEAKLLGITLPDDIVKQAQSKGEVFK
ncbi:tryptophan ABC transporter substrate-binding protein [Liquorilactobacillus mali]|uniref:ABC transporter, substrate binding protein n=1 Tax=Liquorilactobacillus mali KCTC 3596 = DSM 20444 TaxID=1046596 RepID=J0UPR4_9LACO|nr:tryptophan ABC transporter substrate-binding protein [Liquorilactobacillus mali]EJE97542.1 ABC transporter, substrate binding protein [Liquorilactobacillus mali KCTC 3596 = DSM 20444]KRN11214.1 ABC transporter, substrate binding protein [Liquorilactobacillus mali KCTC 3596 = DSM 20444]MDC7953618.1 ABC transporter substrate-binding protein [Liquorilactobacillus mali]